MAEEKKVNGTTDEQQNPEKAPKKTFMERQKERKAEFAEKHPTLTKIGSITGKVVEYTLMAGGALLGVSMVSSAVRKPTSTGTQVSTGSTTETTESN